MDIIFNIIIYGYLAYVAYVIISSILKIYVGRVVSDVIVAKTSPAFDTTKEPKFLKSSKTWVASDSLLGKMENLQAENQSLRERLDNLEKRSNGVHENNQSEEKSDEQNEEQSEKREKKFEEDWAVLKNVWAGAISQ